MIASDKASHPDSDHQRLALKKEFVKRGIARSTGELDVSTNYEHEALQDIDLQSLVESDWSAYRFAEKARHLLRIPKTVAFEVRPRLDVTKSYYHRGQGLQQVREVLFKVVWTETERSKVGVQVPRSRRVTRGTTLAIDWDRKLVRAVLSTDRSKSMANGRDALIAKLLDREVLKLGNEALGFNGRPLRGAVLGQITDGALRVRSTARALHMLSERAR